MAVKSYNSGDNTQLSPHFNVQEFKCKCGKEHEILIADELIEKLEKLYDALNCSKIIVTSGYRCPVHDKAVGGTSSGQHTKGNAADIVCYGQDGQPVSSKLVCCKAQDIGFQKCPLESPAENGRWYTENSESAVWLCERRKKKSCH